MAAAAPRGFIGLIRQGWNEIPEVMGSGVVALIGIGMGIYSAYGYAKKDGNNRRYKVLYVVMRPDDPRVRKIHKD